ncbi:MAG: hypothetical protein ABN478_02360 [Mixta sp.]
MKPDAIILDVLIEQSSAAAAASLEAQAKQLEKMVVVFRTTECEVPDGEWLNDDPRHSLDSAGPMAAA